jgi:hypothetical protein
MSYKVLIVVKDGWWSDQRELPSFPAARKHQSAVADQWNTSETAILAPDGRVLNFMESRRWLREMAKERAT